MEVSTYIDLHERAMAMVAPYTERRTACAQISKAVGRHHVGIIGPRGVGKTIALRQLASGRTDAFS